MELTPGSTRNDRPSSAPAFPMSAFPISGPTGYGLMSLTARPEPVPREQAFAAINNAIKDGVSLLNGGEFYGPNFFNPDPTVEKRPFENLKLLQAYFAKYPENRSKVSVCIKGCVTPTGPDCSPEAVKRSIENIASFFPGNKFELFEAGRMDAKTPVEEFVKACIPFIEKGVIKGISLSEVNANTIRRAAAVYPISCVEVELSLWSTDILKNGIMDTCRELKIPIVAYSPLGRGYLTGKINTIDDLPPNDLRRLFDRFASQEAIDANKHLLERIGKLARKKGCTMAQIALSWVRTFNEYPEKYATVIPIPSASTPERNHENNTHIKLSREEFEELNRAVQECQVYGGRYSARFAGLLNG
ncbi:hypothetical protein KL932_000187 [Ogataea haglerorum]|uniref:NADP-dependent oxidoreductase domain-containing protein n=1 Tax=Ogataea haglerorum TaxID=1937702 RepID=A0ABQ7RMQ6_9ASCO|nr:hypothetical protein KL932_000187 [Ogataea haglerorum]KAG7768902.1 hypothetical protein KL946_000185 [Ogataea haglerorum]KAG7773656.1 hypothetical protein KL922_005167 [Ogataea haglerorum]